MNQLQQVVTKVYKGRRYESVDNFQPDPGKIRKRGARPHPDETIIAEVKNLQVTLNVSRHHAIMDIGRKKFEGASNKENKLEAFRIRIERKMTRANKKYLSAD
ncbi:hypothetical protein GAO09_07730 [Rhizobiales bacterium RZME27]|uniref:Uncharacterized protein n=1 Tax=Endobacterium cereale TaxID=2663029 RepID=A0A6A8A7W0_9HYPH|nr:hypothetical protein [Endobacterium cereale]MQY45947.1 hypothetical protein [Endobacterium cereale]